jgi:hypothetical protein
MVFDTVTDTVPKSAAGISEYDTFQGFDDPLFNTRDWEPLFWCTVQDTVTGLDVSPTREILIVVLGIWSTGTVQERRAMIVRPDARKLLSFI